MSQTGREPFMGKREVGIGKQDIRVVLPADEPHVADRVAEVPKEEGIDEATDQGIEEEQTEEEQIRSEEQ